jgi:adenosylcobinamide-GDP ribazoletransferase
VGLEINGIRDAAAFLTRIPVPGASGELATAVKWFPLVGLGVGALSGLGYWIAGQFVVSLVGASVAVGLAVVVTGAFHEDGLADTFDGLSSIRTVERQLEIMRDSRLGTFGVAALVLTLVARVAAVASLSVEIGTVGVLAWAYAAAEAAVLIVMAFAQPAAEGAGASFLAGVRQVPLLTMAIATFALGWWAVGDRVGVAVAAAVVAALVVWGWARRRIGGITGDVLGACQQMALVSVLAVVAA